MLSIVIPTLNEEHYLSVLLESIKKQKIFDYEIIIADANSADATVKIAKKYNCRVVQGGPPAKGRNNGAKAAKGDLLLFLDADVVLPQGFLNRALSEFQKSNLDIASFRIFCSGAFASFAFNMFYNNPIIVLEKILPHAAIGIMIKKHIFVQLNGFDEEIFLAEDHDLARRAAKISKYGIIKSTKIFTFDRRFKKDGWVKTGIRYFLCEAHMVLKGPVKKDIFNYKFNHYFGGFHPCSKEKADSRRSDE